MARSKGRGSRERWKAENRRYGKRAGAQIWGVLLVLLCMALSRPGNASAQVYGPGPEQAQPPRVIVVGFLGGWVRNDDERHPEVQIIERLSMEQIPGVRVAAFENRREAKARKTVLHWLGVDHKNAFYDRDRRNTTVILFGHSWGASAAIHLARDLEQKDVPVELTIQVDSISKGGNDDCLIPANVHTAMNFYQPRSIFHGCSSILPVDLTTTRILKNVRLDYPVQPASCRNYPWVARHFFGPHIAIECDPNLWSEIDAEIRARIRKALENQGPPLTAVAQNKENER